MAGTDKAAAGSRDQETRSSALTSHEPERRGSVDSSDSGRDAAARPAKLRYKVSSGSCHRVV